MFKQPDLPVLASIGDFGQPYHGLATQPASSGDASVALPNATSKTLGRRFASGDTHLSKRTGWSAVSRTGDAATRDTANGWTWPNYFIFGGVFSITGWVCILSGVPWQVYAWWDGADLRLYYRRFGLFGGAATWSNLVITGTTPGGHVAITPNHSEDGTKACWISLDPDAHGLYEITISGGGSGPSAAAMTKTAILSDDTYAQSSADDDYEVCGIDGYSGWAAESASLDNDCVVKADYIGSTLTKWILRAELTMSASGGWANSHDEDTGACTVVRTESVSWSYKYWLRQDAGVETLIVDCAIEREASYDWHRPGTSGYEDSSEDVLDTITLNGTTWIGHLNISYINITRGDGWKGNIAGARPSLLAEFGVGEWVTTRDWQDLESEVPSVEVYPYYFLFHPVFDTIEASVPVTAHAETIGEGMYSGLDALVGDYYEVFTTTLDQQTNNVATLRIAALPDPTFDWTDTATTSWGPCVATQANSATVLTGANHWVSYHPVTQTIDRSTSTPRCWM